MKKYKLIIVENDEDEQMFMREGFDSSGLFAIIAIVDNGDELLAWLESNPASLPDVVLSDLNMSGKNGYDIIRDMQSFPTYSDIPVVITSTSSTKSIMNECLSLGAADYLVKPDTFIEYVPFAKMLHERIEGIQMRR